MADRIVLLQPRAIDLGALTLVNKLKTIAIGAAIDTATAGELFVHDKGHAFVAKSEGFSVAGTGTATDKINVVPIMTPTDILPRFALPGTLGTGSEILIHTTDVRTTPDTNGKHKQFSLSDVKSWIAASIQGDLDNVGRTKIDNADTTYGFLGTKILGTSRTTGRATELNIELSPSGNKTMTLSAKPYFNSSQITMDTTSTPVYNIIAINGGSI